MSYADLSQFDSVAINPFWYHFDLTHKQNCCKVIMTIQSLDQISNLFERRALETLGGIPDGGITYTWCNRHEVIYMNPGLTSIGQAKFFDSIYSIYEDAFDKNWYQKLEKKRLERISRFVTPPGRLLDIGCGVGSFAETAMRAGWNAWGYEISSAGYDAACRRLNGQVLSGRLEDIPSGWADCLTLFSVVEHNMKPDDLLEQACRICKPGGWIIFNVPNAESIETMFSKIFHINWLGFNVSHSWYWTEKSVRRMAYKAGISGDRCIVESRLPLFSHNTRKQKLFVPKNDLIQTTRILQNRLTKLLNPRIWWRWRILLNTPFDATKLGELFCRGAYLFVYGQRP